MRLKNVYKIKNCKKIKGNRITLGICRRILKNRSKKEIVLRASKEIKAGLHWAKSL